MDTKGLLISGTFLLCAGLAGVAEAQGGGPAGSYSQAQFDDTLIRNSTG